MYNCKELYLYEIIDDYKTASTKEEQEEIFTSFCSAIWASDNKRNIYPKKIRYRVPKSLRDTELGQLFDSWSEIEYSYARTTTKDNHWTSILRQKINNIYTRYFDGEVILNKEYMELLKTPKRLYYEWLSGSEMNAADVSREIETTLHEADEVRRQLQREKMQLPWNDYKTLVESFLKKCLQRCQFIDDYEERTKHFTTLDFINEDHFYVSYFCKRLGGNIKDYQKHYYGLKSSSRKGYIRCAQCGAITVKSNNRIRYCETCRVERNRRKSKERMRLIRICV